MSRAAASLAAQAWAAMTTAQPWRWRGPPIALARAAPFNNSRPTERSLTD